MIAPDTLTAIVLSTLQGLERSGVELVLLICGHYPNDEVGAAAAAQYQQAGGTAKVLVIKESDAFPETDSLLQGDHASKCEISLMLATDETTVDMAALSRDLEHFPVPEPLVDGGWWFEKDPAHPWFGIAGQPEHSPLDASKALGEWAHKHFLDYVEGLVNESFPEREG